MSDFQACEVPNDLQHHVYVLFSATRADLVKVGRASSPRRIRHLREMHYADVADWEPYGIVRLRTPQEAVAVEAMVHACLINDGFRVPRFGWTRLPDMKSCYADECFMSTPDHAFKVAEEMADIYTKHIEHRRGRT